VKERGHKRTMPREEAFYCKDFSSTSNFSSGGDKKGMGGGGGGCFFKKLKGP